jgi:aerobic-type carbon monoxide dehydrogenase small subunit (CoxS/CutS family)
MHSTEPAPLSPSTVTVNGQVHRADAAQMGRSLAGWLREHCGATDTKVGCEEGVCGSCTVLLDGRPAQSCLVPVADCDGREVSTPAYVGVYHPCGRLLAEALLEVDSPQCGFCVGGLMVTATAVVAADEVEDGDIRAALSAHLCRCGGYPRHEAAVALARRWHEEGRR